MKILITGARGTIGQKLIARLGGEHDLCLLSRSAVADDLRWIQADVTNFEEILSAMTGVDVVIHLAIATGHEGDYEEDVFNDQRFDVNVKGTYHVFEAAKRAGVKRVIYTSSLTVVWGALGEVASDASAQPVGTYALTKHLGEQVAQYYAQQHRLSVVCLRIPKPVDIDDPNTVAQPILPQWIAFPDLMQAYQLAIEKQDIHFEIITVVGESSKRRWDLSKAERLLGYQAQYRLEDLGYTLRDEPSGYNRAGVVWDV
jgi:nucleoside-diphosphate-sugar epimerase